MTRNKILRFHENVTPGKLRINDAYIFHNSYFTFRDNSAQSHSFVFKIDNFDEK